jgi:hypothetical protein
MIALDAEPSEFDRALLHSGCVNKIAELLGYEPHPLMFYQWSDQPVLCERYILSIFG